MNYDKTAWMNHFIGVEAVCPSFYQDGGGVITIGIGCVVHEPYNLKLRRKDNDAPASEDEVEDDLQAVGSMKPGLVAAKYASACALYLPDSEIQKLFEERLEKFIDAIEKQITPLDTYPEPAALAITDMAFNLGVTGLKTKFPKFIRSFLLKDWVECAAECRRTEKPAPNGIPKERNDWTRATFLGLVGL